MVVLAPLALIGLAAAIRRPASREPDRAAGRLARTCPRALLRVEKSTEMCATGSDA